MKSKKTMRPGTAVNTVFFLGLTGFLLLGLAIYDGHARYSRERAAAAATTASDAKETTGVENLRQTAGFRDILMFDIFEKGVKSKKKQSSRGGEISAGGGYTVLGVIRAGKPFVVVQLTGDKQPKMFAEKAKFGDGFTVEEVTRERVLVRDGTGQVRTHRIFRYEEVEKTVDKDILRLFQSGKSAPPPARRPRRDKETRSGRS